jgi:Xaa-Pro dipeptidase
MPASLAAQLAETFGPHLEQLCARTARALEASGYTSLLVHSGSLLEVFEDDRTYPFEAHAPFKVWVPLADAPDSFVWFEPGARPRLILNQPQDYWYKSAENPTGYWVSYFDLRSVPDRAAARAQLPRDLSGCAYIGDATADAGL